MSPRRCLHWLLPKRWLGLALVGGCRTAAGPAGGVPVAAVPPPIAATEATLRPATPELPTVATLMQAWLDMPPARPLAVPRPGLRAGAAVRAFYGPAASPAWTVADTLGGAARAALALLAQAYTYGLQPANYGLPALRALRDSLANPAAPAVARQQLARFDVSLTDAVLAFAHDLKHGRRHHPQQPAGAAAQLRTALADGLLSATVLAAQPANREYRQLQQALAQWLAQPPGPPDSVVARHRSRFERIALNLERWRAEPLTETEYLLVNIPAFELLVLGHDTVKRRARVIVGKPATPTPTLRSRIRYFTLAPVWNVPYSIASQEM